MPRRMLRNKVIVQAIRVAFGIGGIYDEDEATDITVRNITKPEKAVRAPVNPFQGLEITAQKPVEVETPAIEVESELDLEVAP